MTIALANAVFLMPITLANAVFLMTVTLALVVFLITITFAYDVFLMSKDTIQGVMRSRKSKIIEILVKYRAFPFFV